MLTRHQLYELYSEGPDALVRLVEQLYDHIAATEPPGVRALRLTVDSQLAVITATRCAPTASVGSRATPCAAPTCCGS